MLALTQRHTSYDARVPIEALGGLLDDLATVLIAVDHDAYVARPPSGLSGSVGGHVRHVLDHVAAFLEASGAVVLTYDHRQRGTSVEHDPAEALSQIYRLQAGLERMAARQQDEHLRVRTQIGRAAGQTITSWSTLGRELAFVMSHTIHHQAMIALLLEPYRANLPNRFGFSPSTPAA